MKKKNVLFGAFAVLAALSLASCKGNDETTTGETGSTPTSTETSVAPTSTETSVAPTSTETSVTPTSTETSVTPTSTEPTVVPTSTVDNSKYLTFDTKGGSEVAQQKLEGEGAVNEPAAPTKSDYQFLGWFTDENCTEGNEFDFSAKYTENTTAYAKWIKILSYDEFKAANIADVVAVKGYIAARQSYYKGGTLYIYVSEGVGFYGYRIAMTEEEFNTVYTVGKPVIIVGPKATYADELEISGDGGGSAIFIDAGQAESTAFTALDISDKLTNLENYQNAFIKATLTIGEFLPGGNESASDDGSYGYQTSKVDSETGVPYDDLYFTLVDGSGNKLACCVEAYLDLDKSVRTVVMSDEFAVGAKVEIEGFLYWYNGANPHITKVTIKEAAPFKATYYLSELEKVEKFIEKDEDGFYTIPTIETPTDTEYLHFAGWFADPECENPFQFGDYESGDVDIYAKWEAILEPVPYTFLANKYSAHTIADEAETFATYFTVGVGAEIRSEGKTRDGITYNLGVKCGTVDKANVITVNVPGPGKVTVMVCDRSNSTSFPKGIQTIDYLAPGATDATTIGRKDGSTDARSDKVYEFEFEAAVAGNYIIGSSNDGSTADVVSITMVVNVPKSPVTGISVANQQVAFLQGRDFSYATASFTKDFENGRQDELNVEDVIIDSSAFDKTVPGKYTINFTYGDYTSSYDVFVYGADTLVAYDYTIDASKRYTNRLTTVYLTDTDFNSKNLTVHAIAECPGVEAYEEFILTASEYEVTGYDKTVNGKQTLLVTTKGCATEAKQTSFDVYVGANIFEANATEVTVNVDATAETVIDATNKTATFSKINDALIYLAACGLDASCIKNINIAAGSYKEKVDVQLPNVHFLGQGSTYDDVVIWFDAMNGLTDPSGATTYSTTGSASVSIRSTAVGFYANKVTFKNYYNTHALYLVGYGITTNSQADALYCEADMSIFDNCKFTSYHDTLEAEKGRQLYDHCYIEGRTDFIFGNNAAVIFNECDIKVIGAGTTEKNGGYIFCNKGTDAKYVYIANKCNIFGDENVAPGSVSLGRTWATDMNLIVMNCTLSNIISKECYGENTTAESPYAIMNGDKVAELNDRFTQMSSSATIQPAKMVEFNNTGDGAIAATDAEKIAALAEKTCTIVTDKATSDYLLIDGASETYAADYRALVLEVFGAVNKKVTWDAAWGGLLAKDASVTLIDQDGNTVATLANISYNGSTITKKQLAETANANIPSGFAFNGYFANPECTEDYDFSTVLGENNTVYLKYSKLMTATEKFSADGYTGDTAISANSETPIFDGAKFTIASGVTNKNLTDNLYTAVANDESGNSYAKSLVPTGGNATYIVTPKADGTLVFYFTITDSSFTSTAKEEGYAKSGELVVNGAQVVTVSGNKARNIAYAYSMEVEAGTAYTFASSGNRLVFFGAELTYAISETTYGWENITELPANDGAFEFINTKDPAKQVVANNSCTLDTIEYTGCLNTGGGCDSGNAIKFVVADGKTAVLTMVCSAAGGSDRWTCIGTSIDKSNKTTTYGYLDLTADYTPQKMISTTLEAGTYYINYNNGIRIYSCQLVVKG